MKIEGWQFLQLAGPYRQYDAHEAAYKTFRAIADDYFSVIAEVNLETIGAYAASVEVTNINACLAELCEKTPGQSVAPDPIV